MKHSVLFTGGIDSTYRLCQLATDKNAVIQPVYILFPRDGKSYHIRPEMGREIAAQDTILSYLMNHSHTKAVFLPIQRIHRDTIPRDFNLLDKEFFLAKNRLGWQYLYFAILAKWFPCLELCHESFPFFSLNDKFKFKMFNDVRILDVDNVDGDFAFIFKDFSWPIFGTSRNQMLTDIREWGYKEVFRSIWWCYASVDGRPCGLCDNCQAKLEEGLKFLFDKDVIHRYLVFLFVRYHFSSYYWRYAFHKYVFEYNSIDRSLNRDEKLLKAFKIFDKIYTMKIPALKKAIVEGSFFYGYSSSLKEQISSYKYDVSRKHRFDYLKYL